jgi:5-formyltetrahydrofolate cyclo-ligase
MLQRKGGGGLTKKDIRMRVWRLMEERNIATFPRPVRGRIPNFVDAQKAAQNLRSLPEYKSAKVVFCNPDSPQRPVREMVLRDGKTLVMATPRLRRGFLLIEPSRLSTVRIPETSTIHGAFRFGRPVESKDVKVDLFIAGSVAVSLTGGRLGKGTGYSDQEYVLLKNASALSPKTLAVTTVHDVQIVENIPSQEWDVPVDVIVTPTRIIRTKCRRFF